MRVQSYKKKLNPPTFFESTLIFFEKKHNYLIIKLEFKNIKNFVSAIHANISRLNVSTTLFRHNLQNTRLFRTFTDALLHDVELTSRDSVFRFNAKYIHSR